VSWLFQAPAQPPPAAPAAPAGTDIYLVSLDKGKWGAPVPVSVEKGYDNQPFFDPGGRFVLFTANRDGKQMDIYQYDRETRAVSQLTRTAPEGEYSPTIPPELPGKPALKRDGFTVIRTEPDGTQRLWQFDRQGGNPQLVLTEIKPVGYHAWVDADRVALFVLGKPATLQLARISTGAAETAASDIGRSLHRVPGTRSVSFVQREASGEFWIKQIEFDTKKIDPLVKAVEGSSDRDYAWLPDGKTILMSAGTKIHSWTRGAKDWTEAFDAAPHALGAITRLAVAPKGDAVAIVAGEPK
jgi:hypothetical protein